MHNHILGIDFGRARIGVAVGQTITNTATPIATIKAKNGVPHWQQLDAIIKKWRPATIIIGLPIDAAGQQTDSTKQAHAFGVDIHQRYKINVEYINEAYSTRQARWELSELKQGNVNHIKVDAIAASIILETWMSEQSH